MCTSGMINSRAFSRRVRPQGPGDEDAFFLELYEGAQRYTFPQSLYELNAQLGQQLAHAQTVQINKTRAETGNDWEIQHGVGLKFSFFSEFFCILN